MLLMLSMLFLIPALRYHYVVDDLSVLAATERLKIQKPKNVLIYLWKVFRGQAYWEDKNCRAIAHGMTIIIHSVVCVLIYYAFGRTEISYMAAVLFALHPNNTEVSVWVSGKCYGTTTAVILALWCFPLLAPLVFFFAPVGLVYFNGILSPLAFLLHPQYSFVAVFVLWLVYTRAKKMFTVEGNPKLSAYVKNKQVLRIHPSKIIIALKFYGYFLVNNLLGLHYSFFQGYMDDFVDTKKGIENSYKPDRYFVVGVLGIASLIYLLITQRGSMVTLGLFWATTNFMMWANFISLGQQYCQNRQGYLANVGLMLMISGLLVQYPLMIGLLCGFYARQLILARRQYGNVFWHFYYPLGDEPEFYYSWLNMGNLQFTRSQFSAAIASYVEAMHLRPNNFKVLFNLSSCAIAKGNIEQGIEFLEKARKADVYAQEKARDEVVSRRMKLINMLIENKMNVRLKVKDIDIVS